MSDPVDAGPEGDPGRDAAGDDGAAAALDPAPLPRLEPRAPDAHKGDCGRVLIVAGSEGLTGAAVLAARGAMRSGAGLVTVACPRSVYPILAAKLTCAMTWPLPETPRATLAYEALGPILERADGGGADAVALGPGLGREPATAALARALVVRLEVPWVADADALLAIAEDPGCLDHSRAGGVLTPHPGEMARLVRARSADVQANRPGVARGFARAHASSVLVLKGAGTLVAEGGAGGRLWRSPTGNPGMATGGTGDVLAGVLAALLAEGHAPYDAARLAVYVHGLAGDLAARRLGERGLIATDVVDALPEAFDALEMDAV